MESLILNAHASTRGQQFIAFFFQQPSLVTHEHVRENIYYIWHYSCKLVSCSPTLCGGCHFIHMFSLLEIPNEDASKTNSFISFLLSYKSLYEHVRALSSITNHNSDIVGTHLRIDMLSRYSGGNCHTLACPCVHGYINMIN